MPPFLLSLLGLAPGATAGAVAGSVVRTVLPVIGAGLSAKANFESSQTDLKKLRNQAVGAGFNPLTVLNATGGQGFNKTPNFGMVAFSELGNSLNQTWAANQQAQNWEVDRALGKAQLADWANAQTVQAGDEWTRLYPDPMAWVDVLNMSGEKRRIRAGLAARLRIYPGQMIIAEDMEALIGDLASEGVNIAWLIEGGLRDFFGGEDYIFEDGSEMSTRWLSPGGGVHLSFGGGLRNEAAVKIEENKIAPSNLPVFFQRLGERLGNWGPMGLGF